MAITVANLVAQIGADLTQFKLGMNEVDARLAQVEVRGRQAIQRAEGLRTGAAKLDAGADRMDASVAKIVANANKLDASAARMDTFAAKLRDEASSLDALAISATKRADEAKQIQANLHVVRDAYLANAFARKQDLIAAQESLANNKKILAEEKAIAASYKDSIKAKEKYITELNKAQKKAGAEQKAALQSSVASVREALGEEELAYDGVIAKIALYTAETNASADAVKAATTASAEAASNLLALDERTAAANKLMIDSQLKAEAYKTKAGAAREQVDTKLIAADSFRSRAEDKRTHADDVARAAANNRDRANSLRNGADNLLEYTDAANAVQTANAMRRQQDAIEHRNRAINAVSDVTLNTGMIGAVGLGAGVVAGTQFNQMLLTTAHNTQLSTSGILIMNATIKKLGIESGASLDDLAHGFRLFNDFGFSATQTTKLLRVAMMASVATGSDLSTTSQVLAMVMKNFNIPLQDANKAMSVLIATGQESTLTMQDMIDKGGPLYATAAGMGLSFTQANAALVLFTKHGLDASQSTTQLRNDIQKIISPSASVVKILNALDKQTGMHIRDDFTGPGLRARTLLGVLTDVKTMYDKLDEKQRKQWDVQKPQDLATKLWPNLRGTVGAIIAGGNTSELADEVKKLNYVAEHGTNINSLYQTSLAQIGQQMDRLKNIGVVLSGTIATTLSPDIDKLINDVADLSNKWFALDAGTQESIIRTIALSSAILMAAGATGKLLVGLSQAKTALAEFNLIANNTVTQEEAAANVAKLFSGTLLALGSVVIVSILVDIASHFWDMVQAEDAAAASADGLNRAIQRLSMNGTGGAMLAQKDIIQNKIQYDQQQMDNIKNHIIGRAPNNGADTGLIGQILDHAMTGQQYYNSKDANNLLSQGQARIAALKAQLSTLPSDNTVFNKYQWHDPNKANGNNSTDPSQMTPTQYAAWLKKQMNGNAITGDAPTTAPTAGSGLGTDKGAKAAADKLKDAIAAAKTELAGLNKQYDILNDDGKTDEAKVRWDMQSGALAKLAAIAPHAAQTLYQVALAQAKTNDSIKAWDRVNKEIKSRQLDEARQAIQDANPLDKNEQLTLLDLTKGDDKDLGDTYKVPKWKGFPYKYTSQTDGYMGPAAALLNAAKAQDISDNNKATAKILQDLMAKVNEPLYTDDKKNLLDDSQSLAVTPNFKSKNDAIKYASKLPNLSGDALTVQQQFAASIKQNTVLYKEMGNVGAQAFGKIYASNMQTAAAAKALADVQKEEARELIISANNSNDAITKFNKQMAIGAGGSLEKEDAWENYYADFQSKNTAAYSKNDDGTYVDNTSKGNSTRSKLDTIAQLTFGQTYDTNQEIEKQKALAKINEDVATSYLNISNTMRHNVDDIKITDQQWNKLTKDQQNNINKLKGIEQIKDTVSKAMDGTTNIIQDSLQRIYEHGFKGLTKSIEQEFSQMLYNLANQWISSQINQLLMNQLPSMMGAFAGGGNGFITSPGTIGGGTSSMLSDIPGHATGGPTKKGMAYLVGEKGPEIRVDSSDGYIIPNGKSFGGNGDTNITVIQNINAADVNSFRRTDAQNGSRAAEASKRAMNRNR